MKKEFNKIIALVLIFMMLTGSFSYAFEYNGTDQPIPDWEIYKAVEGLGGIPYYVSTFPFNKELWEEQGVVVYGDYSLIANNDFKVVTGGYYVKNGINGEYRFHGFDVNGGTHNNDSFPPDADSGRAIENKSFVYQPWEPGSVGYRLYTKYVGNRVSIYNDSALNGNNTVAKWINEGINFNISKTIGSASTDPMDYITIQTAPTSRSTGQGTFIHIDSTGNDWYQSIPIKKIEDKELTPVEALILFANVTNINSNGDVTLSIKVTGELLDQAYYNDEELKSTYYTRADIKKWTFKLYDSINNKTVEMKGVKALSNTAYALFEITISESKYQNYVKSDSSFDVNLTGTVEVDFISTSSERKYSSDNHNKVKNIQGTVESSYEEEIVPIEIPPLYVPIEFSISAAHEILDVEKFPVSLNVINDEKAIDCYVYVEGSKLSEIDEEKFLSGKYKFPEIKEDRIYDYKVTYIHEDGSKYYYKSYVIVYDSIPSATVRLEDPGKVNRKVTAIADKSVTSDYLEAHSNVRITSFTIISPLGEPIYYEGNSLVLKEFMIKNPGTLNIDVTVSNEYGSRNYSFEAYEGEDYAPDLIAIIWNNNLSRLDSLDMLAEGASMDEDTVGSVFYEIYYDENKDEISEKLIQNGAWNESFSFIPDKLGTYNVRFKVKEEFGQETIAAYITDADKKETIVERKFFVDNLIPMTKLYSDVEFNFPKLDVVFLNDEGLTRIENDYIRDHQVDITNEFRVNSMVANIDVWDLHTYEYTQTAYKRKHTYTSRPPTTTAYSADGYSGTLNRYDIDNYPYIVDEGRYVTKTDSKSVSVRKTNDSAYTKYKYESGSWKYVSSSSPQLASSRSYSSDGYTGTIYKDSSTARKYKPNDSKPSSPNEGDTCTCYEHWEVYYKGTVTKSYRVWEANLVTYNNYYGDYKGTVYKYVKQSYVPSYLTTSNKYLVYFTNASLANEADLNYVKNIAREANVILVGNSALKGQLGEDYFIEYSSDTQSIVDQVISITKTENPILNELAILVGQNFELYEADIDAEGDPIVENGYQYVHETDYFDNGQGLKAGAYAIYSDEQYSLNKFTEFDKPGKYIIYRRIKDKPIGYESLGRYSNLATIEIVAHRKPIAGATLDWDYNDVTGLYKTTWVDKSYDPDFQYSDADKGITSRNIRYRFSTSSTWIYEVPDNLAPGTYVLEYVVTDKHSIDSDPFVMNFTLSALPGIQLSGKLGTIKSDFTAMNIPASEYLKLYDVWTRYPYGVRLEVALYNSTGTSRVSGIKAINYTDGVTGNKTGNDTNWNDIIYQIQENLSDANYVLKLKAYDPSMPSNNTEMGFDVTVKTPINLSTTFDSLARKELKTIEAMTSVYANEVSAEMFRGLPEAEILSMTLKETTSTEKIWEAIYTAPETITEGTYQARFIGKTANGNVEYLDRLFDFTTMQLKNLRVINIYDPNWEKVFYNSSGSPTINAVNGIGVQHFPISKFENSRIKLGYKIDFAIDSEFLHETGDKIEYTAKYYSDNGTTSFGEVSLFVEKDGNYVPLSSSEYANLVFGSISATSRQSHVSITDPEYNTWYFSHYLPFYTVAVPKGDMPKLDRSNHLKGNLVVALDIEGVENDGNSFDYTTEELNWETIINSPYRVSSSPILDPFGKGIRKGVVFIYNLDENVTDDLEINREW